VLSGTIAVCTRNRVEYLQQCLASLECQFAGDDELDVLVVDNGSTDGTTEFLRGWSKPGVREVVSEPRLGLSHARNAALRASDADVVLFLDDDALAPTAWASHHLAAYRRADDIVEVGGPILLEWPAGRPRWASTELEHWFSALDLGTKAGPWPTPHGPYGTNMSMRRIAALDAGGFPIALGRKGKSLLSSEEAPLAERLMTTGVVYYEPAAIIVHQVTSDRLSRQWIMRRAWSQGRSNARRAFLTHPLERPELLRHAREQASHAWATARELARSRRDMESSDAFDDATRVASHLATSAAYAAYAFGAGRGLPRL
jgi:glycosyltransferase involved in cell wall biosynthesis